MLFFDVFKGQKAKRVANLIEENECVCVYVPRNLTHEFQPLDVTVNGIAKLFLNKKFRDWYANQITKKFEQGKYVYEIVVHKQKISKTKNHHHRTGETAVFHKATDVL